MRECVMSLVLEDKTKMLRRCFFDVQIRVGVGRDQEEYHQAGTLYLKDNQVPFTSKQFPSLLLYGQVAHKLFPDICTGKRGRFREFTSLTHRIATQLKNIRGSALPSVGFKSTYLAAVLYTAAR